MSHREMLHVYREELAEWRAPGSKIAGVEIISGPYGCPTCTAMSGSYRLDCAPDLPDRCENLFGCSVVWRPIAPQKRNAWRQPPAVVDIKAVERLHWLDEQLETAYKMLHGMHSRSTHPGFRNSYRQTFKTVLWELEAASPGHPALGPMREAFDLISPQKITQWKRQA